MVFGHKFRTRKYALKACKLAREAVKLALIRRDTRRTRQFRFPYDPRKKPEIVGNKAAT